jgi:hypothetical protein
MNKRPLSALNIGRELAYLLFSSRPRAINEALLGEHARVDRYGKIARLNAGQYLSASCRIQKDWHCNLATMSWDII